MADDPLDAFWRPFDKDGLILNGKHLKADVKDAVTEARFERSMDGPTLLTLGLFDPNQTFIREANLFGDIEGPDRWQRVTVEIDGISYTLSEIHKRTGVGVDLVFYDTAAAKLKRTTGATKAKRQAMTRAMFIRGLCKKADVQFVDYGGFTRRQVVQALTREDRETLQTTRGGGGVIGREPVLNRQGITIKGVPADRSQLRNIEIAIAVAVELEAPYRAAKAMMLSGIVESSWRNGAPVRYKDLDSTGPLQLRDSTARSLRTNHGIDIDGEDVEAVCRGYLNHGYGRNFPRGAIELSRRNPDQSSMWVASMTNMGLVAADYISDLSQWEAEGDKILRTAGFEGGAGRGDRGEAEFAVPDRAIIKRYEFRVGGEENYWAAGVRLAEEVGWRFFAVNNRVWFISDPKLMSSFPAMVLREADEGVDRIDYTVTARGHIDEMEVTARIPNWFAYPGNVVVVEGEGEPADGRWLVRTVERDRLDTSGQARLTLGRPQNPKPEPRPTVVTKPGVGTRGTGRGRDGEFVTGPLRDRIVQVAESTLSSKTGFHRYSQQGALTADPTPPAPNRTDCSQWVRAVYLKAGAPDPGSWTGAQAQNGRRTSNPKPGDLVLDAPAGQNHVELYIGGGRTIGHGSEPIDYWTVEGMRAYHGGVFFVTYDFLDRG